MVSYIITVHFLSTSRNVAVCSGSLMTTKVNFLVTVCFLIWCSHMHRENFHSSDYFSPGEFRRSNKQRSFQTIFFSDVAVICDKRDVLNILFWEICISCLPYAISVKKRSHLAAALLGLYFNFFRSSNCKEKWVKPKR